MTLREIPDWISGQVDSLGAYIKYLTSTNVLDWQGGDWVYVLATALVGIVALWGLYELLHPEERASIRDNIHH